MAEKELDLKNLEDVLEKIDNEINKEINQKELNKNIELTGFNSPEEYLEEWLKIISNLSEFDNNKKNKQSKSLIEEINQMNERLLKSNIKIPFEEKIKQYKLNLVEKFILIFLIVRKLANQNVVCDGEYLSEFFIRKSLDTTSNILKIFLDFKNSQLFKTECLKPDDLSWERGRISASKELCCLLLGIDKKNVTKSFKKTSYKTLVKKSTPQMLYKKLDEYVIGQNDAKKILTTSVFEHIIKCKLNNKKKYDKLEKSNTLIIGPTGTGKTFLCQNLANIMNMPFYLADVSKMSETGYVGDSVDTMLVRLANRVPNFKNIFPPSIIYADEIDKIAEKKLQSDVTSKSVQEEFLKMLESDTYVANSDRSGAKPECNISNIMFIAGGAFSGLDKIIEKRLKKDNFNRIGFNTEINNINSQGNILRYVTNEDLIEYGFIPEFLGRFSNIAILDPLSVENLIEIITSSKNNILEQYKTIFMEYDIDIEIPDEVIKFVAQQAYDRGTGARGLKNTFATIFKDFIFKIQENKNKKIIIGQEMLI